MLTPDRIEVSQSIDLMYEQMYERGYTDGLPVIPPTEERVQAFVDYTGRDAEEVVAEIPTLNGVATIEKIAINAVMAGCRPEYMPVLLAALEAALEPAFNLGGLQATTNPCTPLIIVNGPIREQLGINCKSGALGPGWRANATIGRALRLLLVNLGGAKPGTVSKSTQGQPGRYTFCVGENEEESLWEPLHVERGLARRQSAVTVFPACGTFSMHAGSHGVERIMTLIAHSISAMGSVPMEGIAGGGECLIILCPSHARIFAEAGLSKRDVKRILWERGRLPIEWFPKDSAERKRANGMVVDGMGLLVRKPEDLMIMVAGGDGGLHSTFVPGLGLVSLPVTKPIN